MTEHNDRVFGIPVRVVEFLSSAAAIFGVLGAIVGAAWGFWEYGQRIEAGRAAETLKLVDTWTTGTARVSFRELDDGITRALDGLSVEERKQYDELKTTDPTRAQSQLGLRAARVPETQQALGDVEFFFNRLAICVEADLCSRTVARAFFEDTIGSLIATYGGAMQARRDAGWGSFGLSTIRLGETFK